MSVIRSYHANEKKYCEHENQQQTVNLTITFDINLFK